MFVFVISTSIVELVTSKARGDEVFISCGGTYQGTYLDFGPTHNISYTLEAIPGTHLATYLGIRLLLFFHFSKTSFQGIIQYAYPLSLSRHIRSAQRAEYPLSGAFPDALYSTIYRALMDRQTGPLLHADLHLLNTVYCSVTF